MSEECIIREGDTGDCLHILRSGNAMAYKIIDGEKTTLSYLEPPQGFGEIALLLDAPRTATVRAVNVAEVIVIERERFCPSCNSRLCSFSA